MAYGLRYQSDFNNVFGTPVSVLIYEQDYEDSDVTDIRTTSVQIISNYQDDNTPVIGKAAKIVIRADSSDMTYLSDLLLSYERQFECVIEYDSQVVFRGFSVCDLNERQLLPYAAVTVQFTDYLRRLDGKYSDLLDDIAGNTSVFDIVNEMVTLTTVDIPFYVNSTLFEDDMDSDPTDTFLPQVYVQNANFYSNTYDYDNVYEAVNKTLQPFSGFLYSYNDMWILERQEDITRDGDWVSYTSGVAAAVPSLKQEIYRQGSDGENFEYIEMSQIVEYDSGLMTLILNLRDKKLDSLVFNNYTTDIEDTADNLPDEASALEKRTWYKYTDVSDIEVGENYNGALNTWIKFYTESYNEGLYYNFVIQFDSSLESSAGIVDTLLNVSYHMSTGYTLEGIYLVQLRFLLRLVGGPYSDYWIQNGTSPSGVRTLYLYPASGGDEHVKEADPATFLISTNTVDISDHDNYNWSIFQSFNLTDMQTVIYSPFSGYTVYDSLWEALDFPTYQEVCIMFLPCAFSGSPTNPNLSNLLKNNYLGDIQVQVTGPDINNRIEYHLSENFVKTLEVDLYLFDLDNLNYSNGLIGPDRETLTNLWTSEDSAIACPLYEIFAKCKFRKYGRTIHRLKATIRIDKVLKPFCLITDDTILNESDEVITFLLNGFTWDLNNGIYDIEAEEYTEEEIIVDGVTYDSYGQEEGEETPPSTPTGLNAYQLVFIGQIRADWTPMGGVAGYKLQRKPYYSGGWVDSYKIVYNGTSAYYNDPVASEGDPDGQTFSYKVCAYNDAGESDYTDPAVDVEWFTE